MKLIFVSILMVASSFAYAAEPCENFAKYFAIRDYKARAGSVPGSFGIEYTAKLLSSSADEYTYQVEITDNNEDGEVWTIEYAVVVKPLGTGKKCELVSLKTDDL